MRISRGFRTAAAAVSLSFAAAITLAACGSTTSGSGSDGKLTVVASTNVWGSVARAVAGDRIQVTSIITQPSSDPHSYEASPADAAAVTSASLVVYNGGGYDHFVDEILASRGGDTPTVNAFELFEGTAQGQTAEGTAQGRTAEGTAHDGHGTVNEHVWYDTATVDATARAIAERLGELDPEGAAAYRNNAEAFHERLRAVSDVTAGIAAVHPGAPVAQTEPIAYYLIAASGLKDETPVDFTSAIENGNDPAPAAIAATRNLLIDKQVRALVYNVQTADKVTQEMRSTAEQAGIPVVEVSETLPEGRDYIQWQTETAEALASALNAAP